MNKKYTFTYAPLVLSREDFYQKIVLPNPNLNHQAIKAMIDKLDSTDRNYSSSWYDYLRGKNINAFSFIQNCEWIAREHFNGVMPRFWIMEVSNFEEEKYESIRTTMDKSVRKWLRIQTEEEKKTWLEKTSQTNPSGYNIKLHREHDLIIHRFLNNETILDISAEYGCTTKVIYKILNDANVYKDEKSKRKNKRTEDIRQRKLKERHVIDTRKSDRAIASKNRLQIKETARIVAKEFKETNKPLKIQIQRSNGIVVNVSEIFDMGGEITKDKILSILKSKPHNNHYIERYINFIYACMTKNSLDFSITYTEIHHICPKAKDLFPEYFGFINNPWNKAVLTARQHFIAHWMLWKAYGGSQAYAFKSMNHQKSKYQLDRYVKLNAKTYELLRIEHSLLISNVMIGKAAYRDSEGNTFHCNTDNEKVLSGEYVSVSQGRTHIRRTKFKGKSAEINDLNLIQ